MTSGGRLIGVSDRAWSRFVRRGVYDTYHIPEYVAVAAEVDGGEPIGVLVEENDDEGLLLPLIAREIPTSSRLDVCSPYGYPGPLLRARSPEAAERMIDEGVSELRRAGFVSAFVRCNPVVDAPRRALERFGRVQDRGLTVVIDATLDNEARWRHTRATVRNEVRRSRSRGEQVHFDNWAHEKAFRALYRQTMQRVGAEAYYHFDDDYFDGLGEALVPIEHLHLTTMTADGEVVAGALWLDSGDIVQYHLSASAPKGAHIGGAKRLIVEMSDWAHRSGRRVVHLGGGVGGAEDSLFAFKSAFSPTCGLFYTWELVLDDAAYIELNHHVQAGLPGFFPPYRAPSAEAR